MIRKLMIVCMMMAFAAGLMACGDDSGHGSAQAEQHDVDHEG